MDPDVLDARAQATSCMADLMIPIDMPLENASLGVHELFEQTFWLVSESSCLPFRLTSDLNCFDSRPSLINCHRTAFSRRRRPYGRPRNGRLSAPSAGRPELFGALERLEAALPARGRTDARGVRVMSRFQALETSRLQRLARELVASELGGLLRSWFGSAMRT